MEEFDETMFGSFELRENMFRKKIGIVIKGADGKIYHGLAADPDSKVDVGQSLGVDKVEQSPPTGD